MSYYEPEDNPHDPYAPREGFDEGDGDYPDMERRRKSLAKGRVVPPAIALIVVAALNLIYGLAQLANGLIYSLMTTEQFAAALTQNDFAKEMNRQAITMEQIQKGAVIVCFALGGFYLLTSILTIIGGARMISLKSYSLAISPSACCGFGIGIGIWSLVVLMSADVRAAFR
jgi:hypothetical protein